MNELLVDRLAVDGEDPVAARQPGALGSRARPDLGHDELPAGQLGRQPEADQPARVLARRPVAPPLQVAVVKCADVGHHDLLVVVPGRRVADRLAQALEEGLGIDAELGALDLDVGVRIPQGVAQKGEVLLALVGAEGDQVVARASVATCRG